MFLSKFLQQVRDAIFPQQCVQCGVFDTQLCYACAQDALSIQEYVVGADHAISHLYTVGEYSHPVWRILVKRLKFSGISSVGLLLGALLAECFPTHRAIIVPIPLHPLRLRERGYNQAEIIASSYAAQTENELHHLLQRTKNTKAQSGLPEHLRNENTHNAFTARMGASIHPGAHIVLIDDVITSGATIRAAADALQAFQPKRIDVIAVARSHDILEI